MEESKKPRVLSLVNQKGGVSKTTVAAQIAYGMARRDKKVLVVDMDPQSNLTTAMGIADDVNPNFTTKQALTHRELPGVHNSRSIYVIPATIHLAELERSLIARTDWQFLLSKALKPKDGTPYADLFPTLDFIIIDSPPNLGLLTVNTLMAAEEVIIPLTCDTYAFNGITALTDTIGEIRAMSPALRLMGVVASRVDMRRKIDQESLQTMKGMFADILFDAKIPENTKLKEAGGLGKSIWEHDSGGLAVLAFDGLCEEILQRGARG